MPKKILFVYRDGRRERITQILKGHESPAEFLYGFTYLNRDKYEPDFAEINDFRPNSLSWKYWKLRRQDKKFAINFGIGRARHIFVGNDEYLNKYELIVGTNDSLSMGLLHHKKVGTLKPKIIFLTMGFGGILSKLKHMGNIDYEYFKNQFRQSIIHTSAVVTLGEAEYNFYCEEYESLAKKFKYIPFGVDTAFWCPVKWQANVPSSEIPYCLFVGNDPNRDYEALVQVATACPKQRFVFVTSKISPEKCPSNVELINGSIWQSNLSDKELRELYRGASLVLLPLKDTIQPTGQSVALQAMACGTPVVMTKSPGLWDKHVMKSSKNCILTSPNGIQDMVLLIQNLTNVNDELQRISANGLDTVRKYYSSSHFSKELEEVLDESLKQF